MNWISKKMHILSALGLHFCARSNSLPSPPSIGGRSVSWRINQLIEDLNPRITHMLGVLAVNEVALEGPHAIVYEGTKYHSVLSYYKHRGIKISQSLLTGSDLRYAMGGKDNGVLYLGKLFSFLSF